MMQEITIVGNHDVRVFFGEKSGCLNHTPYKKGTSDIEKFCDALRKSEGSDFEDSVYVLVALKKYLGESIGVEL
jgi:hypothetical protein